MNDDDIEAPTAGYSDRLLDARLAGHDWGAVDDFLDKGTEAASASGWEMPDILGYLGFAPAEKPQHRMEADAHSRMAGDNVFADALKKLIPGAPLTPLEGSAADRITVYSGAEVPPKVEMPPENFTTPPSGLNLDDPAMRSSYARSLFDNEVRSPRDFAERYTGALGGATGVDPAVLVRASGELAQGLPSDRDFTDQAIAIAHSSGVAVDADSVKTVRNNLIDHWSDTGQPLMDAYKQAQNDPEFAEKLTTAPPPPADDGSGFLGFFKGVVHGMGDVAGGAVQLASHSLPDALTENVRQWYNAAVDAGLPLYPVPQGGIDQFIKERDAALKADHSNQEDWSRWTGQVAATLPMFTTFGLTGLWGMVAAGATQGVAQAAFKPETAEDYWKTKGEEVATDAAYGAAFGGALHGLGKAISAMAPQAAEMLRNVISRMEEPKVKVLNLEAGGADAEIPISKAMEPIEPAKPETVRLYRGETDLATPKPVPDWVKETPEYQSNVAAQGRWFTRDLEEARHYAGKQGSDASKISYVDAPAADVEKYLSANQPEVARYSAVGKADSEYFLPRAMADTRQPHVAPEPPPSALEFHPEATPAQKVEALAQDVERPQVRAEITERNGGEMPHPTDHDYFEKLAAGQDPATVELAKGHDAATGVLGYFKQLGANLMADESGSLNILRTPQQEADRSAYLKSRDYARPLIVRMRSAGEQIMAHLGGKLDNYIVAGKLENVWKMVNPHMKEWEGELAKGINGNPMGTKIGKMISYVEGRSMGAAMPHDNPLTPAADAIRYINEHIRGRLEDAFKNGTINQHSYFEDYFRHLWKDPNKATRAFEQAGFTGKQGSSAGLQQRKLPTIEDGLKLGLEPAIAHPLELTLHDAGQKIKYVQAAEILKDANANKYVTWRLKAHDGEVPLNGFSVEKSFVDAAGHVQTLRAYANPGFANAWNDWLSLGFHQRPGLGSSLYDKMAYSINTFKGLQLVLPFFHAVTMAAETTGTAIGRSIEALFTGHPLEAAMRAGEAVTGIAPVRTYLEGLRGTKSYLAMTQDPALQHLIDAGMRVGPRQDIYRIGHAPLIWDSIKRGSLGNELRAEWQHIVGNASEPTSYRIAQSPFRLTDVAFHEVGRIINTISGPLFDHIIPHLKVGANIQQMQDFLRHNPTATQAQIKLRADQIVRNTDERLGEMNMDNVFWPKAVKQTTQVAMLSQGWVYGWMRFMSSAAGWNLEKGAAEFNPVAMRTLAGFGGAYMMSSLAYQYLMTGKAPTDTGTAAHDLLAPRTGGTNMNGSPVRALLPSQAKELMDYYKIGAYGAHDPWSVPQHVAEYGLGKMPNLLQLGRGLLTGQDAIGNDIAHTAGGWPGFIGKQVTPIFASGFDQRKKNSGIPEWQTLIGIKPMTRAAEDPTGFYEGLAKLDKRNLKQQQSRARYENRVYERARPIPGMAPAEDDAGPTTKQRSYRPAR